MKGKLRLMNLIAICTTMTSLVEEVRAMDIVYFIKAFHTVSYNTLIGKVMNYRLDKWSARQSENWLT